MNQLVLSKHRPPIPLHCLPLCTDSLSLKKWNFVKFYKKQSNGDIAQMEQVQQYGPAWQPKVGQMMVSINEYKLHVGPGRQISKSVVVSTTGATIKNIFRKTCQCCNFLLMVVATKTHSRINFGSLARNGSINSNIYCLLYIIMIVFYPFWLIIFPEHPLDDNWTKDPKNQMQLATAEKYKQMPLNEKQFEKLFQLQLRANKKIKKNWTSQEDQLITKMKNEGREWKQISNQIGNSSADKCKRRYQRLQSEAKRWPKQIDQRLIQLYESRNYSWSEIACEINKLNLTQRLNSKQVKQRYLFYLKQGISKQNWSIEEDLKLINLIQTRGKCWKSIGEQFGNRTQLQLKNRYYGTLKFIQSRVLRKLGSR